MYNDLVPLLVKLLIPPNKISIRHDLVHMEIDGLIRE